MRSVPLVLLAAIASFVVACSSGGTTPASPGPNEPAPSPASARVEVTLTDALKIELSSMNVMVGVPVTFVVTNSGSMEHEFYIGDEAAQAEHEAEMAEMGGMSHDEPGGIGLDPGETKELTYTFDAPGTTLVGCHVAGHYSGGMKAEITVTG